MNESVILVNQDDKVIGEIDKMEVHRQGLLHRAFSIFIFNSDFELLLQQRASNKYHSGALWTNTCCGHPVPGEDSDRAALRRLQEEMGFQAPLKKIFNFIYKASVAGDMTEHELDHVYIGFYDDAPSVNPGEVMNWKYSPMNEVNELVLKHPEWFTVWFTICYRRVFEYIMKTEKVD